ncbi:transcription elongation factor Spt5 [Exidia glandulosa HHB12029]|uniref:Transcription elongation factor SPT5 n=1 Tax=Exidia glandulosa HHB12029 TaxID=1314781 RepID=A0A165HN34_EXIGL|nr:transcription elongation factor Spt5 [Exidia glandulosa HHB12029]
MSDDFDEAGKRVGDAMDDEDDDAGYDAGQSSQKKRPRDLYEDEDDDDDEEDDEEDEEDDVGDRKRKKKRRKRRTGALAFIDAEAEVDDDDEDDEDEGEHIDNDFVVTEQYEPGLDTERSAHRGLRRQQEELNDEEIRRIADRYKQRGQSAAALYTGDMDQIPQRLLMPSVNDANLWQVRVKPGREKELVFNLMRKSLDLEFKANPLQILSAFQHDSLSGMIYVEARGQQAVMNALQGFVGVFLSRPPSLVPIDEMASLLQIRKKEITLRIGDWVRIKRGKYVGDLAQVIDTPDNEEVGLRFVPRIDLNPREETGDGKRKQLRTVQTRPPQRLFNYEEVVKVYTRKAVARKPGPTPVYVFQGETYINGFCEKDLRISAISTDNVAPTLEEVERFSSRPDADLEGDSAGASKVDLSIIADAARKAAIIVLQPGDHVEVYEGEQTGLIGVVESVMGDIVTLRAEGVDIEGQKIEVPARSVRKRFKPGDHVKVMTGKNADETGLVVSVADNVVTFLSDMSMQEVSVFAKDLREAAEVGASTNMVGNYELHDLVQLDPQSVGVIFKTERDSFRVLDQHGHVRTVQPHQISARQNNRSTIATDSEGYELNVGDNLKEVEGEGRKGRLLHVHQSYFAFLHNRDIPENGGVFVARARALAPLAPRGMAKSSMDLTKMNPALAGGAMPSAGTMDRGFKDPLRGAAVTIVQGGYKGYIGTIKETNGAHARVELSTNNKTISIEKSKLRRRDGDGRLLDLDLPRGGGGGGRGGHMGPPSGRMGPPSGFGARTPNPYGGSKTPNPYAAAGDAPFANGRTPNPYAGGGKTPAWNSSSKTPNPWASNDGKTPAWAAGSKTPNAYSGTPAWQAQGRTPNPYASGAGGRTPAHAMGGRTPNPNAFGGRTPNPYSGGGGSGWGATDPPARSSGWGATDDAPLVGGWGATDTAPTPAASGSGWGEPNDAPTPGAYGAGAPTPYSAPTPFNAPTPISAPTPAAPTPGPGGDDGFDDTPRGRPFSAPTPFAGAPTPYGGAPTPASAPTPGGSMLSGYDAPMPSIHGFVLDPRWLKDSAISDTSRGRGLVVEFRGLSRRTDGWASKATELESKQGIVLSVLDLGGGYTPTATVLLRDGSRKEESAVPIELLVPIHPTSAGQQAVALHGPNKGEIVAVQMVDGNQAFYVPASGGYQEIDVPQLCLWDPVQS